MKKISSMIIALAVVSLTLSAAYAYGGGECRKPEGKSKGRVFQELNLTPEQEKQLETNRSTQRQEMENLLKAIKQKQDQLRQALNNPAATEKSVAPLVNEVKSLQAKLLDNRVKGILAVKAILTPEQFAKFQEMTKDRQGKRREHFRNKRQERKGEQRGEAPSEESPL